MLIFNISRIFFLQQTWLSGKILIIQIVFKYLWWTLYRAKPIGSTSDAESFDFDRMKQVSSEYHSESIITVQKMKTDWSANYYKICCVQKEILEEVVRELQKVKEEIIDGKFWGNSEIHDHLKQMCTYLFSFSEYLHVFLFLLAIRRELLRIGST